MTKSLEEMREVLGEAFDHAAENYNNITDYTGNRAMTYGRKVPSDNYSTDNAQRLQAAAACMQAAAMTADALTKVEREITMRDIIKDLRAAGADVEVDFEKGIVRSISPMSKIKLKSPGDA